MSAEKGWHKVVPKKDDTRVVTQAIHSWVQSLGGPEKFALSQEPDSEPAPHSKEKSNGAKERDETLATLLRAIQGTETARRLRSQALPGNGKSHAPAAAEPANADAAVPMLEPPVEGPPPTAAAPEQPSPDTTPESKETLAILLRAIESSEFAASPAESEKADADAPPEQPPPDGTAENKELLAEWIRAVESAESAASLTSTASPAGGEPDAPMPAEPEKADADAPPEQPVDAPPSPVSTQPDPPTAVPPEQPPPDGAAESKEIFSAWMRAMENAESAASLRGAASPGDGQPDAPAAAEPSENVADAAIVEAPVAAPPPAASAKPESSEPEPPVPEPPSPPAPDEPSNTAEPPPDTAAAEDTAPPQPADTAEESPAETLPSLSRPAKGGLLKAPILVTLSGEIGRLCTKTGLATDYLDRVELQLERWFEKWFATEPRLSQRVANPPLVAYHWIVDAPQALKIADISSGGLHLLVDERWPHGNIMSMTLQRTDIAKNAPDSWIAVDFVVLRWCNDGIAGAFLPSWPGLSYVDAGRAENCADKKMLEHFVKQLNDDPVQH